jgi:hypothetical protein
MAVTINHQKDDIEMLEEAKPSPAAGEVQMDKALERRYADITLITIQVRNIDETGSCARLTCG